MLDNKINLIASKDIKESEKFIYGLVNIIGKHPNVKVRVVDLLGIFKKQILDIKVFNDDYNNVFGALESDVLNRTDSQDFAVNIIIGAGQYKKKLSKGGIEVANNMFSKIINSKKCVFVLIDDYDKLRTLKLESWFSSVNITNGIWLGTGFSSQSIFSCNTVTQDDKKYTYEGLAYSIKDSNYTVIKTMLDGEE